MKLKKGRKSRIGERVKERRLSKAERKRFREGVIIHFLVYS